MATRSFVCEDEFCGRFREDVSLDTGFGCAHKRCLGHKLLLTPPPLPARPFWKTERFLTGMTLLMVAAFVVALLIQAAQRGSNVAPERNPRFEVQSLVASAENLLRLWRAKLVAVDTAQTKWVNGQRVTAVGRTSGEALDRIKLTSQEQRRFDEIVQQKEKEIVAEMSRYQEIIKRVTAFPSTTIQPVFVSLRNSDEFSSRGELAVGLAERHAQQQREGRLELKVVYSDYENAALR